MVVGGSKGVEARHSHGQEKTGKFEESTPFSAAPSQGTLHSPHHSLLPLLRQLACASQPTPSHSFPETRNSLHLPTDCGTLEQKREQADG